VLIKKAAVASFEATIAENLLRIKMFNVIFACIIAFGVVYNTARIALAERSRELATLRVMGFTRAEISAILLGELAVLVLASIPLGLVFGYVFAWFSVFVNDAELFRVPLYIRPSTYAFATTVVLLAALASALVVRRGLDRLDLVAVLKSRE
jgi:putative ABC transport system permease protein